MLYVFNLLVVFQVLERSSLPFTGASSRVVAQVRFFRAHPTLRTLLATDSVAGCEVLSLLLYRLSRKGLGHASDSLVREVTLQFFLRWLVAAFPHYLALRIRLIVVVLGSEHDVSSYFPFILCTSGQLLLRLIYATSSVVRSDLITF